MSTPTTSLQLQQITTGDQSGTWGTSTNTNMQLIDDSIAGVASITFDGVNNYTLSTINYASDEARKLVIIANGSPGTANQIVAPLVTKFYVVVNRTNIGITIGATTGTTVAIPYTTTPSAMLVYCDGTNFYPASNSTSGTFTANIFSGAGTNLTGTASSLSIGGNAATATTAGKATNIAGGATGNLPYQSAVDTTSFLSLGTNGYILTAGSTAPQYTNPTTISIGTATNLAGGSVGYIPYQTSSGTTSFLSLGTTNYVLTAGASGPQYVAQSTLSVGSASTATTATTATTSTNIAGGAAGSIVYQTGSGATSTLGLGTTNYVLTAGASAPQYVAQSTLSVGSATTATTSINLAGGALNRIPYQTGSGATSFIAAPVTGGTFLEWDGTNLIWATAGSSTTTNSVTFNNTGSGASSGIAFNNSANVTVSYNTIGASPLAGSSSLTTVGTISSGTWQGSAIQPSYVATLNQNTTGTAGGLSGTPNITVGTVSGTTITASSQFSGPGTGLTGTAASLSIGGSAATATSATSATTATNVAGGATNKIVYQTGANTTGFISAPTVTNSVLTYNGTNITWATSNTTPPTFSAYMSTSQSISSGVDTKMIFDTVTFDTNSNFSTTNYRYTPTIAGYYLFYIVLAGGDAGLGSDLMLGSIFKNGTVYISTRGYDPVGQQVNLSCSSIIYMNGTTDYVEVYATESGGSGATIAGTSRYSQFGGHFIRS